jgi:hypothetical protein
MRVPRTGTERVRSPSGDQGDHEADDTEYDYLHCPLTAASVEMIMCISPREGPAALYPRALSN